jgi:hypothetical protein
LVAVGVLVIVLGMAGVAIAATPSKTAKACVTAGGVLRLKTGPSCPGSTSGITLIGRGAIGTVRAYAHVRANGTVDASRSWNVATSNVVTLGGGFTCFRGMGFIPDGAQVTLDYHGINNGQIPQATVILPAAPADCGLSAAAAEVFTGLVNPGVFTDGAALPFYVIFY